MGLKINGSTSGSIEIDVPAVAGTDTSITIPAKNGGTFIVEESTGNIDLGPLDINGSASDDSVNIDSSGRLLVGTSDSSGTQLLKVNGSSSGSTNGGTMSLTQGRTAPPNGSTLGVINFGSETRPDGGAQIVGFADGAWTDGSDYNSGLYFATTANGATSPTDRMRILESGQTIHFASSDNCLRLVNSAAAGTTYANIYAQYSGSSTTNTGSVSFAVFTNGNVQNTNNSYGSYSDIKLKENIVDANSQWDDLKALQVRNYNFKEETGHQTHTQIGLVAQEVELVSPGLVSESPDVDEDGNDLGTVTKSVNYSVLYMKSVKALQEAMTRIEALETANASLEARLTALEGGA